jgi:hypothetical protein
MKFNAKLLHNKLAEGGRSVYVLMESEKPIVPGANEGTPVAVVTSEQQANLFIGKDAKHRNWFMFNLDELPDNVQPVPEPLPLDEQQKKIDETRQSVEKTTQDVQQFLQGLKSKKRR